MNLEIMLKVNVYFMVYGSTIPRTRSKQKAVALCNEQEISKVEWLLKYVQTNSTWKDEKPHLVHSKSIDLIVDSKRPGKIYSTASGDENGTFNNGSPGWTILELVLIFQAYLEYMFCWLVGELYDSFQKTSFIDETPKMNPT